MTAYNDRILSTVNVQSRKPVVFSLVANTGTIDGRVMKQATALVDAGYDVWLYARLTNETVPSEIIGDIKVKRFDCFQMNFTAEQEELNAVLEIFADQQQLISKIASDYVKKTLSLKSKHRKKLWFRILRKIWRITQQAANKISSSFSMTRPAKPSTQQMTFYLKYLAFAKNFLTQTFPVVPDIIHSHDLVPLPAAAALAKRTGARLVFDAHEIETERVPSLSPERKLFIAKLERDLLKHVNNVVVCCESAADFYQDIFQKRRPVVVMNAPDDRFLDTNIPVGADVRSQCALSSDIPLVIYSGSVGFEARGLDKIVEAIALLPGYHLAIQGPRNPKFDGWLNSIIQKYGCTNRIHLLQPVSQDILVGVLRSGDVGVCAFQDVSLNHRYALPNKIFEMAFADLPLCLSNLVEMKKFVAKVGNGVTMDETDSHAIAAAIQHVYQNKERYRPDEKMKLILKNEYAWTAQRQKLTSMYQEMR